MASILCVTNGLPGMLFSSLELARRLAAAGHRVTYASLPDTRDAVTDHGVSFLPLTPSQYADFADADARSSLLGRLLTLRRRRTKAIEAMALNRFVDDVRRIAPDLILIDGEMHEHVIAAWPCHVPIVLMNTFASIWRRPGLPPAHRFVLPGVGWWGTRIGIWLLWLDLRVRKWWARVSQKIRRLGCDRLSLLRRLARHTGFDFRRETDFSQWLKPFTYRHLPVVSLHALEFEFPHTPRAGVRYVGPMVPEERVDRRVTDDTRAELEDIFDRRREAAGERRLIYVGFGSSFSADIAFVRRVIEAAAARPDWDLLISGGDTVTSSDMGPLPRNARTYGWLPQVSVLKHADVALTHGGINTIDECVICRVPMLVYCGVETDMAGNAARVRYHGIGIVGDRHRDSAETIRGHVDRLLIDPRFRDNVDRMRSACAAYSENRVVERTVESLLS